MTPSVAAVRWQRVEFDLIQSARRGFFAQRRQPQGQFAGWEHVQDVAVIAAATPAATSRFSRFLQRANAPTRQRRTLCVIQSEFSLGLPGHGDERFAYGARSEAAVYVGDLLSEEVPALAQHDLEIVAIARRPGVLSKVAIRSHPQVITPMAAGIGADHVARVRERLDGERIEIINWRRSARAYIADALGLGVDNSPPMVLLPGIGHARVLLGEIDVRGIAGWRGLNTALASALTGWRIRLEPVALTPAWARLEAAMRTRRSVQATVVGSTERGVRLEVLGLFATLATPGRPSQDVVEVRVTRMDADEGRIFVSDRLATTGQLPLV